MRPADLAEVLWKLRGFLEQNAKLKKRVEAISLVDLDGFISGHLRNLGHDPGRTAEDADALKLALIHAAADESRAPERGCGDTIQDCLERVVEIDGAAATPYRVVGRWSEFVNRAVLGPAIVADDQVLPVHPWVKARGVDTQDFAAMAQAYVEWSRDVSVRHDRRSSEVGGAM